MGYIKYELECSDGGNSKCITECPFGERTWYENECGYIYKVGSVSCQKCDDNIKIDGLHKVVDCKLLKRKHTLKIEKEYFDAVNRRVKNFEIRKDDRGFMVGDEVILVEVENKIKTDSLEIHRTISYVFKGGKYGLDAGYVVLQLV